MKSDELKTHLSGKTAIYVEDNNSDYTVYEPSIKRHTGLTLIRAVNNGASLEAALSNHPNAVAIISDIERPGGTPEGLTWAEDYVKQPGALPVILTSASRHHAGKAEAIGVTFLEKGGEYKDCRTFGESIGTMLVEQIEARARTAATASSPLAPERFLQGPPEKRDRIVPDGSAVGKQT